MSELKIGKVKIIANDENVARLLTTPVTHENERRILNRLYRVIERNRSIPRTPETSFPHILGAAIRYPRGIRTRSQMGPIVSAIVQKIQEGGPTLVFAGGTLAKHKNYLDKFVYKLPEDKQVHLVKASRRLPSLVFDFVHPLAIKGETHMHFGYGNKIIRSEPYLFLPAELVSHLVSHDVMPTHQRTQVGLIAGKLVEDIAPETLGNAKSTIFSGRISGFGERNPSRSSAPMNLQRLIRSSKSQFLRSIRRGIMIPSIIGSAVTAKSVMDRVKKLNKQGRL